MALFKYLLTLVTVGILFVGLIYLITFVVLGVFQAVIGYSAKKSSEERKQQLIRRSEPVLLVINSYLYATCVAALTRASLAARPMGRPWIYYLLSFAFLLGISSLPHEKQTGDSTARMRYFLLTFLAAGYLFPDFIAPFWKNLWGWWFT
ncbi:MAG: hypothetical protein LAO21_01900 [Acidobacteriia bacterium]|nr:hypothetical protein [Terriglobia bacterium]